MAKITKKIVNEEINLKIKEKNLMKILEFF